MAVVVQISSYEELRKIIEESGKEYDRAKIEQAYRLAEEKQKMEVFSRPRQPLLEFLGRHSLVIYLLHQPVIYGILLVVFL